MHKVNERSLYIILIHLCAFWKMQKLKRQKTNQWFPGAGYSGSEEDMETMAKK